MVLKRGYSFGQMVLCRGNGSVADCMVCVQGIREGGLAWGVSMSFYHGMSFAWF